MSTYQVFHFGKPYVRKNENDKTIAIFCDEDMKPIVNAAKGFKAVEWTKGRLPVNAFIRTLENYGAAVVSVEETQPATEPVAPVATKRVRASRAKSVNAANLVA